MQKLIYLGLVLFLIGCSKGENHKESVRPRVGKPLPEECSSQVLTHLRWKFDGQALYYRATFTLLESSDPFLESDHDGANIEAQLSLERGGSIQIQVVKQNPNNYQQFFTQTVYVPSCEERELWREGHPSYEEPLVVDVNWTP